MAILSFDDFKKLDLRVGKILKAEKIEGSEKLLKLEVDLGLEKRQLVAGIALQYPAEELINREIIVVANLEPRKIKDIESQGMLLAADDEQGPILLMPDKETLPGTPVK